MNGSCAPLRVALLGGSRLRRESLAKLLAAHSFETTLEQAPGQADVVLLCGDTERVAPTSARVCALLRLDHPSERQRLKAAGVASWVPVTASGDELAAALRATAKGESVRPAATDGAASEIDQLTAREVEILRCLASGEQTADVAERLGISPHTVRTHLQNTLGKLNVSSRHAAVAAARNRGLIATSAGCR